MDKKHTTPLRRKPPGWLIGLSVAILIIEIGYLAFGEKLPPGGPLQPERPLDILLWRLLSPW